MKIAYGSDFHFEFIYYREVPKIIESWEFEEKTDLIIIAGDLHVGASAVMNILELINRMHDIPILYVPGNHEYYGSSFEKENNIFRKNFDTIDGVTIFRSDSVIIDEITFLGCAGNIDGSWQDIYQYKHGALNDFHQISDFENHDVYGRREHNFLEEVMRDTEMPMIAITHTMPSPKCISEKYKGSVLNPCFANDWEDLIFNHKPLFWICGHTHDKFELKIDETMVMCNPVGYPHENKQWTWEYINVCV